MAVSQDYIGIEGKYPPISIKEQVTHFLALLIDFQWFGAISEDMSKTQMASR